MGPEQIARKADARMDASIAAATYVREAREAAKMTQKQLADALMVRPSRICDIEHMRERPGAQFAFDSISLPLLYEVQAVTGYSLIVRIGGKIRASEVQSSRGGKTSS